MCVLCGKWGENYLNRACLYIENCCDCPYSYKENILTADPFEHEYGVYCSKVEDNNSYNGRNKLVAADDWDVKKYSQVPDWCPIKCE